MKSQNIPETTDNYYILNDDGSKSPAYTLDELAILKINEIITSDTPVIKNGEDPKPAEIFIDSCHPDITENAGTKNDKKLQVELNTLNFGAFILFPFWGYSHFPKYRVFWGCIIAFVCLSYIFLIYKDINPKAYSLPPGLILLKIPQIVISIIFLVQGNRLAWRNRKFESINQFKNIQKKWLIWGFVIFLSFCIISFFTPIILAVFLV